MFRDDYGYACCLLRTCLVGHAEVVQEIIAGGDRALSHKGRAIGPVRRVLEHPVPVLPQMMSVSRCRGGKRRTSNIRWW